MFQPGYSLRLGGTEAADCSFAAEENCMEALNSTPPGTLIQYPFRGSIVAAFSKVPVELL